MYSIITYRIIYAQFSVSPSPCQLVQAWWLARPGFDLDKALGDPCEALATAEGGLHFPGLLLVNWWLMLV